MDAYVCDSCGYYYDPVYGADSDDLKEGTPFANLPDDWTCPECGASKATFSPIEDDDDLDDTYFSDGYEDAIDIE